MSLKWWKMTLFEIFVQVGVTLFSILSIFFVNRKDRWHRYGSVFGILAQPFWFYIMYTTEQWGLFFISFIYAYSWSVGFYNNWIKKGIDDDETSSSN